MSLRNVCLFLAAVLLSLVSAFPEEGKTDTTASPSTVESENTRLREIISILSTKIGKPEKMKKRVSVEFIGADLRTVIAMLAKKHNINLYGAGKITGTITAHLKDVPLDNLLETLLNSNGYTMVKRGEYYYEVLTTSEAEAEKKKEEALNMRFQPFDVRYVEPSTASSLLTTMGVLDANCKVAMCPETNQLIIQATEKQLRNVSSLLKEIDIQPPQILIRARVVEVIKDVSDKLGIEWMADFIAGDLDIKNVKAELTQAADAATTFSFGLTHPNYDFDMLLEALVQSDIANILTAPRLTTTNNVEAKMTIADQLPVVTRTTTVTDSGATVTDDSVSFVSAGLEITMLPRKVGDNQIYLKIRPVLTQYSGDTDTDPPQPIINTRETTTEVIVKSNQWLVIGGLITTNTSKLRRKIPFLGDIPLLGIAFSSTRNIQRKRNLLVLVNAQILDEGMIRIDTKTAHEELESLAPKKK